MPKFPTLLAYDDACHLKRFCNRRQTTAIGKFFANTVSMVVDKLHFSNHTDSWCKANVNPHKVKAFDDLNTEACEQTFKYVARFCFATKHMTYGDYNIFHFTMAEMFNNDKIILASCNNKKMKK